METTLTACKMRQHLSRIDYVSESKFSSVIDSDKLLSKETRLLSLVYTEV